MGRLTNKLQDAVKKLSYKTTVDQLKKKGIQNVNVVGLDRIVALIEAAVHRTLKARMAGFEGGLQTRGAIADATRDEFLKLLHSKESLERAQAEANDEKANLASEVERLHDELRRVQTSLELREKAMRREEGQRAAEADEALHHDVERLLEARGLAEDGKAREAIDDLMAIVQGRIGAERKRAAEARRAEHQHEVDLLNRRLGKLNSALQDSESELQRVMRAKGVEETGIASIYRDVQGLADDDSLYAQKKELMASIFEANRKLQRA